jgi:hypothetical protein
MAMFKTYFSILILVAFLVSCGNENNSPQENIQDSLRNEKSGKIEKDSGEENEEAPKTNVKAATKEELKAKLDSVRNKKDIGENLSYDDMIPILPESIEGFEKFPVSTSTIRGRDGYRVTSVKGQFRGKERNTIIVDLYDYGVYGEIPFRPSYYNPGQEDGYEIRKIEHEFGTGFIRNDPVENDASLNLLVNDRFVIIIRSDNNKNPGDLLVKILEMMDIQELKNKVK